MSIEQFQISLDTLIGTSRIMGHWMENRAKIRNAQDRNLLAKLQSESSAKLRSPSQMQMFAVAPLDLLVTETNGQKQFHVIEINGTGIGGLTNMTEDAVKAVLDDLTEMAENITEPDPVVLIASSGFENAHLPRQNKLIYEKILYAEAVKKGFANKERPTTITTMAQLRDDPRQFWEQRPTAVIGYMKEFLLHLRRKQDGSLTLFDRSVTAAINDRFCLNVVQHFDNKMDMSKFRTINACYLPGADKGVAYQLLNDYVQKAPSKAAPERVHHKRVYTREELIETVQTWLKEGIKTVIKPQGTGLGHGIEFFLDPNEPTERVVAQIDHSLSLTEAYYGLRGGALPYTVCEFIDTCAIPHADHPLYRHKYELRIVVYRDGMELKAFPAIVKISSQVYDAGQPSHLSLINNITTSSTVTGAAGVEYMLPLCTKETIDLLGIPVQDLQEGCAFATNFIRYVLDQVEDHPDQYGLK